MAEHNEINKQTLERFIKSYIEREIIQSPDEADVDAQIANIIALLAEKFNDNTSGSVIDIGAGHGTLLNRIAQIQSFSSNIGWIYVAIDEDSKLDEISRLARGLGLLRRVDQISLESFYHQWPTLDGLKFAVCRNVLHELSIDETAQLLHHVASNFSENDTFLIQDLLRFPESERHHACWLHENLVECLEFVGFESVHGYMQGSAKGNAWFNVIAKRRTRPVPDISECRLVVTHARQKQWELLSSLSSVDETGLRPRSDLITALDIDLQLTSLTRELRNVGALKVVLPTEVEKRIRVSEFSARIENFVTVGHLTAQLPAEYLHFRERGEQLNVMEAFLRSDSKVAVVWGGVGTGKTTFINHLLRGRLYDKAYVSIDGRVARGAWSIIEQIFAQVGLKLAGEFLSVIDNLSYQYAEASLGRFFNNFSSRLIVVIDNFEKYLDSNGHYIDSDVGRLIGLIASKDKIKVIFAGRSDFIPRDTLRSAGETLPVSVRVGRYGTDQTVINILDDHFDRAKAGLQEYPSGLIQAIDRHPSITTLAGQILQQVGTSVLLDAQFINELKQKLRVELIERLVDEKSVPAVEMASKLRVAVPAQMLERLVTPDAIFHARNAEVLHSVPDRRWNYLLATLGVFRKKSVDDLTPASIRELEVADDEDQHKIASAYRTMYQNDDDPKWIREAYYHRMLSGEITSSNVKDFVGKYYAPELIASADYCFKDRHDYVLALELYNAALTISSLDEQSLMWRASCLMRTGSKKLSQDEYKRLIKLYPKNIGIKTSYVDALLSVKYFQDAIEILNLYNLSENTSDWVMQQWGRCYLGLHEYESAIRVFGALIAKGNPDPRYFVYKARALQQFGDLTAAIEVLRRGRKVFSTNKVILTSLGADLERAREDVEALEILEPMFETEYRNTRAALAIIRIHLRRKDVPRAEKTYRHAAEHASGAMRSFLLTAEAEIRMARDDAQGAIDLLNVQVEKDENHVGLIMEAYVQMLLREPDLVERKKIISVAGNIEVPNNWRSVVPVQLTWARLAIAMRDLKIFESAVANLELTKISRVEIDKLKSSWKEDDQDI